MNPPRAKLGLALVGLVGLHCGGQSTAGVPRETLEGAGGAAETAVSPSEADAAVLTLSVEPAPTQDAAPSASHAEPSPFNLEACRDDDLFIRVSGEWFAGEVTEFRFGCEASSVAPYARPAAYHQGLINDFQVVVEACGSDARSERFRVAARFDVEVVDGQRSATLVSANAQFDPRGDGLAPDLSYGLKLTDFEDVQAPVDWSQVGAATPPSDRPYSGRARIQNESHGIDVLVEFVACHIANLRSVIVQ